MHTPIKVKSNSQLVYNNHAMTLCIRSQGIGLSLNYAKHGRKRKGELSGYHNRSNYSFKIVVHFLR